MTNKSDPHCNVTIYSLFILTATGAFEHKYKKAMLLQRQPRDTPYVWMPWKILGVAGYAQGYFS